MINGHAAPSVRFLVCVGDSRWHRRESRDRDEDGSSCGEYELGRNVLSKLTIDLRHPTPSGRFLLLLLSLSFLLQRGCVRCGGGHICGRRCVQAR